MSKVARSLQNKNVFKILVGFIDAEKDCTIQSKPSFYHHGYGVNVW